MSEQAKHPVKLRLYNTLTRNTEDFEPIQTDRVRMYVCGPTVYDFAHIGNARPIIVFDVLFRLLRHLFGPEHVVYARNITDVDDKINERAATEGISIAEVTAATTAQFHSDIEQLNTLPPTVEPRATEHIAEMRNMIEALVTNDHAYVADSHVLFDVESMPDYGQLSKRPLEDMIAGARVEVARYKKNATDFVLWKPSKSGEPAWDSPCGISVQGRPGWHIECSAMSARHLGEVFDIHGGGIDLVFPHHENEVAQSRCTHGTETMARFWMHNGFVQVEGEKMSKSLGNFITIHDLLESDKFGGRRWPGNVLRIAMLMTHYREPIDWTLRRLEEAENRLTRWRRLLVQFEGKLEPRVDSVSLLPLLDDLSSEGFLNRLHEDYTQASVASKTGDEATIIDHLNVMAGGLDLLGIEWRALSDDVRTDDRGRYAEKTVSKQELVQFPDDGNALIEARLSAIRDKDWGTADEIRNSLSALGIKLNDHRDPESGERTTTWEVMR